MRTKEEVEKVLALVANGLNDCEISRVAGIPVTTVKRWRDGEIPGVAKPGAPIQCPICARDLASLDRPAYAYLLGQYLGDGGISRMRRGVFKLSIYSDLRYPNIIEECAAAMAAVMPRNVVGRQERHEAAYPDGGCAELRSLSKHWPCLFPQHGPGRKRQRSIILASWQQEIVDEFPKLLIRGLIHSDGSRHLNRIKKRETNKVYAYTRYEFSNRSDEIREIFVAACDRLGIHWTVTNRWNISVARRQDVQRLDTFVGPKT